MSSEEAYPSSLYVEHDVRLTARRAGMIEQVLVDRGSTVRKGQLLASVETEEADHELEMAQEEQRLAQADYDRMRPLSEEKMISPQELFRAE
ncbi:MAG: hypothetical protein DMF49_06535, partial [Acidobacteria bacterium]